MSASGAHIFYQPEGAEDVVDIDLGRPLTTIEDYDVRDESVSVAFSGSRTRVVFTATRNVDVTCDLIDGTDYEVVRQLEALMSHLRRGGVCSISENNRTLGAYLETFPISTSPQIAYRTNLYRSYGNYTPLAGDILVLQGPSPGLRWEEVEVNADLNGGLVELTEDPRVYWEGEAWIFVRNKGFWPALRLRDDAPAPGLIGHGNRIAFSLVLPLEVPPNAFDKLSKTPDDPLVLSGTFDDSLDGRINASTGPVGVPGGGRWW